jgi:hypothetical protein
MKNLLALFVALSVVTSSLGCEPLPGGKECPAQGIEVYPGKEKQKYMSWKIFIFCFPDNWITFDWFKIKSNPEIKPIHTIVSVFPDEDHCSKYWECDTGCGSHIVCQRDYLYNIEAKECQPPRQVSKTEKFEIIIQYLSFLIPRYFADPGTVTIATAWICTWTTQLLTVHLMGTSLVIILVVTLRFQ